MAEKVETVYGLVKGNLEILPYWNAGKIEYYYLLFTTPAFSITVAQGSEMHCSDIYSEIVELD